MKTIHVLVDTNGRTTEPEGQCILQEFKRDLNGWGTVDSRAYNFDSNNIQQYKKTIEVLARAFDKSTIFVGKNVIGTLYRVMDQKGVHIWEHEGEPSTFLEAILNKELKFEKGETTDHLYKEITDDVYFIDVGKVLLENEGLSSKKILKPFIEDEPFKELQVLFSHIPPWLEGYLRGKSLQYETLKKSIDGTLISISKSV